jgi:hypothetical protein
VQYFTIIKCTSYISYKVTAKLKKKISKKLRTVSLSLKNDQLIFVFVSPREFTDCVGHIRLLSWLLLGSLTHTALTKDQDHMSCQPLPLESSSYISDHVMVIMTGFAEQSKVSS